MRVAKDFRMIAREVLNGKWKIAILVGLVAAVLGGIEGDGAKLEMDYDASSASASFSFAGQTIFSTGGSTDSNFYSLLVAGFSYVMLIALIIAAGYYVLGGIISVGYAKFNLMLVDGLAISFDNLFEYFSDWKTITIAKLLRGLYVLLWSLLFIIPGIMVSFSYSMTDYILAEHPDISATEAINLSKEMMAGNRWRLFCLEFSFIGWQILCIFTLGVGNLWLNPYKKAAMAAFYREVSGTENGNNH